MRPATKEWLRPSMLPKLAECIHYRSEADAGEAAARGNKLDGVFRAVLAGENVDVSALTDDEREAVKWAVETARAYSGGDHIETREDHLKVSIFGMEGTADAFCEPHWIADLKTGIRRNYLEQQAAYALGFMEQTFTDEMTVYLLYCDLQEVDRLHFTIDEARAIVRGVLARVNDGLPPQRNDYCGWCAKRFECEARKEAVTLTLGTKDWPQVMEQADSAKIRDFLLAINVVEDMGTHGRDILKQRIITGEKIKGVSMSSRRGSRRILVTDLQAAIENDPTATLALLDDLSEDKALKVWQAGGISADAFPAEKVQEMPGSSYITVRRPKAPALKEGSKA